MKNVAAHFSAVIFGKQDPSKLTTWQKAVNEHCKTLVKSDPSLILDKGRLFTMGKEKTKESYHFAKGSSQPEGSSQSDGESKKQTAKYKNTNQEIRHSTIYSLKEELT